MSPGTSLRNLNRMGRLKAPGNGVSPETDICCAKNYEERKIPPTARLLERELYHKTAATWLDWPGRVAHPANCFPSISPKQPRFTPGQSRVAKPVGAAGAGGDAPCNCGKRRWRLPRTWRVPTAGLSACPHFAQQLVEGTPSRRCSWLFENLITMHDNSWTRHCLACHHLPSSGIATFDLVLLFRPSADSQLGSWHLALTRDHPAAGITRFGFSLPRQVGVTRGKEGTACAY